MKHSLIEGTLMVASLQIFINFVGVYALGLGASDAQVGLLTSLPFLLNAAALVVTSRTSLTARQAVRRSVWTGSIHRIFVALIPLAPLFGERAPHWVILTHSLASAAMMVTATAWQAAVSDMFPAGNRGRIFGIRSMIVGFAGFLGTLVAGRLLDLWPFPLNFSITFWFATLLAIVATFYLAKLDPADDGETGGRSLPLAALMRTEEGRSLGRLLIPVGVFNIGFNMLAPVINIYFVNHLNLSNAQIGLLTAASVLSQTIGSAVWGGLSDRVGNYTVTLASAAGLAFQAAVFWLSPSLPFLIGAQLLGGFCYGGFLLGTFNAVNSLGGPRTRSQMITWFHALSNLAAFIAPLAGSAVLGRFGLVEAFLVAAGFRAASALLIVAPARTDRAATTRSRTLVGRQQM